MKLNLSLKLTQLIFFEEHV